MGLEQKDSYMLTAIENGFYRHLPLWIDEAVRFFVRLERNRIKKPADCCQRDPIKRRFNPENPRILSGACHVAYLDGGNS